MASVQAAGFVDAFRRCQPEGPGGTMPAAAPSVRLDYIMLDGSLAATLTSCRVAEVGPVSALASDHLPVVAGARDPRGTLNGRGAVGRGVEREAGVEPATFCLESRHSAS